jgi:hypothetical protein
MTWTVPERRYPAVSFQLAAVAVDFTTARTLPQNQSDESQYNQDANYQAEQM